MALLRTLQIAAMCMALQVGRRRCYTPQVEDVGCILKVDIVSCESAAGFAHELGRTFSVRSDRVSSIRRHYQNVGQGWALLAV